MIIDVPDVGKCDVLNNVWYTLPDWINKISVQIGIVEYVNEWKEHKTVIGICTGKDIEHDIKMIIQGGVPYNVSLN